MSNYKHQSRQVTVPWRPRKLRRVFTGTLVAAAITVGGIATAAQADATPGCETVPWGFLGSKNRTICDGPIQADGSWMRERAIWWKATQVPMTCNSWNTGGYGGYSSGYGSTTCIGGYMEPAGGTSESYRVTAATVLPDEPGHLG